MTVCSCEFLFIDNKSFFTWLVTTFLPSNISWTSYFFSVGMKEDTEKYKKKVKQKKRHCVCEVLVVVEVLAIQLLMSVGPKLWSVNSWIRWSLMCRDDGMQWAFIHGIFFSRWKRRKSSSDDRRKIAIELIKYFFPRAQWVS